MFTDRQRSKAVVRTHNGTLLVMKNEIMLLTATWMDLEITMLNEASWIEENKYHTVLLTCEKWKWKSGVSDSLGPHRLYSPWNSPGQNTGVSSISLLQGIFLGIEPRSPELQVDSLPTELSGKPFTYMWHLKDDTNELIYKTETVTDRGKKN